MNSESPESTGSPESAPVDSTKWNEPYMGSYRQFQKYEPYIKSIVDAWPQMVELQPVDITIDTLQTRLRICIGSLAKNLDDPKWVTSINKDLFKQIHNIIGISVAMRRGFVTCGPRTLLTRAKNERQPQVRIGQVTQYEAGATLVPSPSPYDMPTPSSSSPMAPSSPMSPIINLVGPPDDLIRAVILFHHHQLLHEPSTIRTSSPVEVMAQGYDVSVVRSADGETYTIL